MREMRPGCEQETSNELPRKKDVRDFLNFGRPPGTRTPNQRIKSPLLYQLS
jgi:hypothetical protein